MERMQLIVIYESKACVARGLGPRTASIRENAIPNFITGLRIVQKKKNEGKP